MPISPFIEKVLAEKIGASAMEIEELLEGGGILPGLFRHLREPGGPLAHLKERRQEIS